MQWFANRRGRFAWPQLCDRPVRYSDTLPTLCSAAPGPVPRYGAPRVSLDSDSLACFRESPGPVWSPSVFRLLFLCSPSRPLQVPHTPVLAYQFTTIRIRETKAHNQRHALPSELRTCESHGPPPLEEPALRPRIPRPLYMRPPSPPRNRFVPPRLAPKQQPAV